MQSVLSRIWTRVAVSISYDDNHYTTDTSIIHHIRRKMIVEQISHYISGNRAFYLFIWMTIQIVGIELIQTLFVNEKKKKKKKKKNHVSYKNPNINYLC